MKRTLRGPQRSALFKAFGGQCAICAILLDPNKWHADHVKPFSKTKRTNYHEMQPLCIPCNLKKSNK
jgi:5-methylcytosine-specific restriction endonuclease McrA